MKPLVFSLLASLFIMIFVSSLNSREPEFTLLAKSGDVEYKANKRSWKSIKSNQEFGRWDMIRIEKGGYACLVSKDGRTLELKADSRRLEYTVTQMKQKLKSGGGDISSKFAEYVVDEMSDTDEFFSEDDYHDDMSTTGAVNRAHRKEVDTKKEISSMTGDDETSELLNAVGDAFLGGGELIIVSRIPKNSYLIDKQVDFSWYSNHHVHVYAIHLVDRHNKEIFKQNVLDTFVTVDFSSVNLIKGENYYWYVTDKKGGRKSDEYCLQWMSSNEEENVRDTVDMIYSGFGGEDSPFGNIAVARYYADKNVMTRALSAFEKAMSLAPGVEKYEYIYAKYLDRIGLTDEAKKLVSKSVVKK